MIIDFVRYIRGYVHFKLENGIKERFINLCTSNCVQIWKIKNIPGGIIARCKKKDLNMICEYAKKSNSQLVIIRKIGLPFIIKKYNKRWGVLIGALFLCFVLIASQNFIWIIEFNGNKNLSQERLISQLSTIGIKKGAYIPAINFRDKQQEALIKMSELGWISFNRDGSKISVEISERVLAPEIMPQTPCNIIAKKTGQIKYMEIYNGECIKKLNDTVCDGDIIVKGETVNKKGGILNVHSDAKIIAQIQQSKSFKIALEQTTREFTGKIKKRRFLDFFGINVPLFLAIKPDKKYELTHESNYISFFKSTIPIGIKTNIYKFYDEQSQTLSVDKARKILQETFLKYEKTELIDCAITEKNTSETLHNGFLFLTTDYVYEENIAKKSALT